MRAGGARPGHRQPEPLGGLPGLDVQVEQHLEVIRDEADRRDHYRALPARGERLEVVGDVGVEPGHLRRAAAALVDDRPVNDADGLRDEPCRLGELGLVGAVLGHRNRDRVRGEREVRTGGNLRERIAHTVDVRLDESRVVEEHPHARHLRRIVADGRLRVVEILAVLAAAGVRAERGGEHREGAPNAVVAHLAHRVAKERVPVAVAEVHRQLDTAGAQLGLQGTDQRAVLRVDRAHPVEQLVVVGDVEQALTRDVPSARHVLEKRQDVVHAFRPPERHEDDCVVFVLGQTGDRAVGWLLALLDRRRHPAQSCLTQRLWQTASMLLPSGSSTNAPT